MTEPDTLTKSSDDSAFLWPNKHMSVILYSALSKAFMMNDDPQGAMMQQLADERYQVARADLWLKQYDRPDRLIILDDDYYLG